MKLFTDLNKMSEKDSNISTKRFSDLKATSHFIQLSWITAGALIYFQQFTELVWHTCIVGILALGRGLIAKEGVINALFNKKSDSNTN